MKVRFQRKMNEFNPEAGGESGQSAGSMGNSSTGEAGTNTDQATGSQGGGEAGSQDQNTGDDDKFNFDSLPKSAQDYIKNLRQESAEHRTKNNNLSTRLESIEKGFQKMFGGEGAEQDLTPEQQIEQLQSGYENLSYQNAVMGIAYENGIPQDNLEYFNFLMEKAVNGLEEGQELEEENLLNIIQKAKGFSQSIDNANTSVDERGQGGDPNQSTGLTLEGFLGMNVVEKSELYRKQPEIYNKYMAQAKEKRLL
jgi:hypothetical protein